ncbi:MAG: hypothetical protein ACK4SV_13995, partial [Hyphomonas sp.]
MAAFLKFLFVVLTTLAGVAATWWAFPNADLTVPTHETWQDREVWIPWWPYASAAVGSMLAGLTIVSALPKRGGAVAVAVPEIDYDRLADAVAARLAPQNDEAPDPARAETKAEAITRTITEEPEAAREIAEGNTAQGFEDLEAAARADMANAARKWRDIGALAFDTDPARALTAYREATRLDASDFWAWIYLARLEQSYAGNTTGARVAAQSALEKAGDAREKSVALRETGDVAVQAGDLAGAQAAYAEGLELARALSASNPGSAEAKRDVSVSLNKLGDMAVQAGDLAGAKAAYAEGLELARALSASNPGSAEAKRDVSVSLERLGDVAVRAGDLAGAQSAYAEGLELRRALSASNPGSAEAKRDVSVS